MPGTGELRAGVPPRKSITALYLEADAAILIGIVHEGTRGLI
jgi:hypothetical protein